jgi:hypothetical protein
MSNEELRIRLETLQVRHPLPVCVMLLLLVAVAPFTLSSLLARRMALCSFAPFYAGKSSRGPTATGTPWKTCRAAAAALPSHVLAIEFIHIHIRSSPNVRMAS